MAERVWNCALETLVSVGSAGAEQCWGPLNPGLCAVSGEERLVVGSLGGLHSAEHQPGKAAWPASR